METALGLALHQGCLLAVAVAAAGAILVALQHMDSVPVESARKQQPFKHMLAKTYPGTGQSSHNDVECPCCWYRPEADTASSYTKLSTWPILMLSHKYLSMIDTYALHIHAAVH